MASVVRLIGGTASPPVSRQPGPVPGWKRHRRTTFWGDGRSPLACYVPRLQVLQHALVAALTSDAALCVPPRVSVRIPSAMAAKAFLCSDAMLPAWFSPIMSSLVLICRE